MRHRFAYRFLLLLFLVCPLISLSADKLVMSEHCEKAYQYFICFRLNEAKAELAVELATNKQNLMPYLLINYEDFITLCFNENPVQYKQKKFLLQTRLNLLDNAAEDTPYFLFMKSLLYFQWAFIEAKHTEYTSAALHFRKAHLLLRENQKKFPDFEPNQIYLGLQEALIGSIPSGYKWIGTLLGLKGDLPGGMQRLKTFVNGKESAFREEAMVYYIYLKNYLENDPKGALQMIQSYKLDVKNNLLYAFMTANLSLNNKNAAQAEKVLSEFNSSNAYYRFPMLDYEMGEAKMKRLDISGLGYYQKFIQNYKGYFYIKDCYYQMALLQHMQGHTKEAEECISHVLHKGYTETDADKQALKNAKNHFLPNIELLKARLLNDGGYNKESLALLQKMNTIVLKNEAENLEYTYRFARVYDDLGVDDKAIYFYKQTLEKGENSSEYFAARSALQMGFIYERKKQLSLAKTYLQKVLDMDNHDYKNSLDQRAKAGLSRVK